MASLAMLQPDGWPKFGASGLAELSCILIFPVQRIHVQDFGSHGQKLVAKLERVPAPHPGIIQLGIEGSGILKLRITGLAAELGKPADVL